MMHFRQNANKIISDFRRSSLQMVWPPLCQIKNELAETENDFKFKRRVELPAEVSIDIR